MTGRTFWVVSFVLLVVASHLAFVLFGTRLDSQSIYDELVAVTGTNQLKSLSVAQGRQLNAASDISLVHAVCAYDLSGGPVKLVANLPENYWSVNIYSLNGDVIYTLNDRQANTGKLSIVIRMGESSTAEAPAASNSSGEIQVVAAMPQGLAVLRSAIIHETQRKRVAETLDQSECGRVSS